MKTPDKNERPDSLKYQWKLYGLVSRSDWATSLDKSIAYEIVDKYSKDFGNSRASLRYLQVATGAARPNVISSLRRLTEKGPFDVLQKGIGTSPTKYKPLFDLVAKKPSGNADNTTSELGRSGNADDTTSGNVDDTARGPSGNVDDTESDLQLADLKDGLIGEEGITDSAPSGDAASASAGAAPEAAGKDGFEALYNAYGVRRDKAAARAAYDELNPDTAMQAHLVEVATAWRLAAEAKPGCKRRYLVNWLKQQRYDEDAPGMQSAAKPAPAKPTPAAPANSNVPSKARQWQRVEIVNSEVKGPSGDNALVATLRTETGETLTESIILESSSADEQEHGQRQFERLRRAVGLGDIEDTGHLLGLAFERRVYNGKPEYRAIAAEAA